MAESGRRSGAMLRPIATPLVIGGFARRRGRPGRARLLPRAASPPCRRGAGAAPAVACRRTRPLRPGDADRRRPRHRRSRARRHRHGHRRRSATRVYAFGHPFYNLGPTQFPMTQALRARRAAEPDVVDEARHRSATSSARIEQDRATAIAGTLGAGPSMLPIHARARDRSRPASRVQVQRRARPAVHAAARPTCRSSTR